MLITKLGQRDASFQKKKDNNAKFENQGKDKVRVISRVNHANALVVLLKTIILSINYKKNILLSNR